MEMTVVALKHSRNGNDASVVALKHSRSRNDASVALK